MRWIIFLFVFLLPTYMLRFPIYAGGAIAQIPFLEMAGYVIAVVVVSRDTTRSVSALKKFFSKNRLFSLGFSLLWVGLIAGIFQSNDMLTSIGIVRGWFFAPCAWFFTLIILKEQASLDFTIARAFAFSAGAMSAAALLFPHFNQDGRIIGFSQSPNYLAMYVAPLIPLVGYQAQGAYRAFGGSNAVNCSKKYGWFFVCGLCITVTALSFSFGSWLGLAVASAGYISWLLIRFHKKIFFVTVFFCGCLFLGVVVLFHARLMEKVFSRLGLWQAAWNMAVAHPLFGIGEGMFQTAYQIQKHIIPYPVPLESALHPHNIFFTFWLYAGLPGLAGFLFILVWIARRIYERLEKSPLDFFVVAVACSFVVILVHGLVDTTYWKNDLAFMWWTLMALLA